MNSYTNSSSDNASKPDYEHFISMNALAPLAKRFALQILGTTAPFLSRPAAHLDVLDVGCGYGHTAIELARLCRSVVGIEPSAGLYQGAVKNLKAVALSNIYFRNESLYDFDEVERYDLVVLDNVFEHLPEQARALQILTDCLRPGGAMFLLLPNKLWPIEVHYHLPFLSYLPLSWANLYLRATGRGRDYADASYAPSYWRLRRLLGGTQGLSYAFVLPTDPSATIAGFPWHYRLGMAAIRLFPSLWAVSKSFLVVAVKHPS